MPLFDEELLHRIIANTDVENIRLALADVERNYHELGDPLVEELEHIWIRQQMVRREMRGTCPHTFVMPPGLCSRLLEEKLHIVNETWFRMKAGLTDAIDKLENSPTSIPSSMRIDIDKILKPFKVEADRRLTAIRAER